MNFLRLLIKIPLLVIVIIFAVINNDFATFNIKPFDISITVSLSVLILALFFAGYLLGRIDSFVANARTITESKKDQQSLKQRA